MIRPRIVTLGLSVRQVRRLRGLLTHAEIITASPSLWEPSVRILELRPDLVVISCEGEAQERVCDSCRDMQVADVPVLIVKSESILEGKLRALQMGPGLAMGHAEEFLSAWVDARRRRPVVLGVVKVDPDARQLVGPEAHVPLTPTEFQVLDLIVAAGGHLVTRDTILEAVWGIQDHAATGHVKHVIWMLRKRLAQAGGSGREIETVRGHGYRLTDAATPALVAARSE
ncbi:response regulator transcription factor [bacterium]|nr:response regulator transcription factor [bacterium]